jgi:hypothetical protein
MSGVGDRPYCEACDAKPSAITPLWNVLPLNAENQGSQSSLAKANPFNKLNKQEGTLPWLTPEGLAVQESPGWACEHLLGAAKPCLDS